MILKLFQIVENLHTYIRSYIRFVLKIRIKKVTLSSTQTTQFNTLVQHKDHTFSAQKIPKFNTKNPSVPHTSQFKTENPSIQHTPQFNTPLSSTPKTPQFNTENPSVPHRKSLTSTHPSVQGVCGTEGFLVWN